MQKPSVQRRQINHNGNQGLPGSSLPTASVWNILHSLPRNVQLTLMTVQIDAPRIDRNRALIWLNAARARVADLRLRGVLDGLNGEDYSDIMNYITSSKFRRFGRRQPPPDLLVILGCPHASTC